MSVLSTVRMSVRAIWSGAGNALSTAMELAQKMSENSDSYSGNARSMSALSWFFSDEHSSTSDMRKRARSRMPAVASSAKPRARTP